MEIEMKVAENKQIWFCRLLKRCRQTSGWLALLSCAEMLNSDTIKQAERANGSFFFFFFQIVTDLCLCWNVKGRERHSESSHIRLYFRIPVNPGLTDGWSFCPHVVKILLVLQFWCSWCCLGWAWKKPDKFCVSNLCLAQIQQCEVQIIGCESNVSSRHLAFGFRVLFRIITDPIWHSCAILSQKEVF